MILRELFISPAALEQRSPLTREQVVREILRATSDPREFHFYHGREPMQCHSSFPNKEA